MTAVLSYTFSATGVSPWGVVRKGSYSVTVGTPGTAMDGTVRLERTYDGGTTVWPVSFEDGTLAQFTGPYGGNGVEAEGEEKPGIPGAQHAQYRFNCTALGSGTIPCRIGQ